MLVDRDEAEDLGFGSGDAAGVLNGTNFLGDDWAGWVVETGEFGFSFFKRFDGERFAFSDFAGETAGNGDRFSEALDFGVELSAVVWAILEDAELLASGGKLIFKGEAAGFLRFIGFVGAGVEVFEGFLGFFELSFEGGNPLGFGFEGFASGFEFGGGLFESSFGN